MYQNASKCIQNELCKCFIHEITKDVVFITFKVTKIDELLLSLRFGRPCTIYFILYNLGSSNKMTASMFHGGKCWMSDPDHPNYLAGRRATKTVYGVEPDLTREGGSIPVTLTLQETTGKNYKYSAVHSGLL